MPPADDLKVEAEPLYPIEALGAGPEAADAEDQWWNEVLAWGRTGWGNVARICRWSRDLGKEVPAEWCDPPLEELPAVVSE